MVGVGEAGVVAGPDVPELVGECLDRLRRVDVIADPHGAVVEAGVAVGAAAVTAAVSARRMVGPRVTGA